MGLSCIAVIEKRTGTTGTMGIAVGAAIGVVVIVAVIIILLVVRRRKLYVNRLHDNRSLMLIFIIVD